MNWIVCSMALPAFGERVLIPTEHRVEIAQRIESGRSKPGDTVSPAFVWELEGARATFHPRQITHWMSLPSRP